MDYNDIKRLYLILFVGFFVTQSGITAEKTKESVSFPEHSSNLHEKPEIHLENLAGLIHEYINRTRENKGIHPLQYDTALAELAKVHSYDMAKFRYFDHVDPSGLSPTERAKTSGYTTVKRQGQNVTDGISENIIRIPLYKWVVFADGMTYHWRTEEEIAQSVLSGWLESPGHRENLLNPDADRQGIGVVITEDLRVYVTQDLW